VQPDPDHQRRRDRREKAVTPPSLRAEAPDWSRGNDLIAYVQWAESTASASIRTDVYVMEVTGGRGAG
jgi:hypothetical protein